MSDENSKATPAAPAPVAPPGTFFTFNVTPKELIVMVVLFGGSTLGGGTVASLTSNEGSAAIVTQVQELRQAVSGLTATAAKVADHLVDLQKQVNTVQTQLTLLTSDGNKTEQQLKDHEERLRRLEGHR